MKKILILMLSLLVFSCKRTNLNKYCIKNINVEIFSLYAANKNEFHTDSVFIDNKNKDFLILFTINKDFVSVNPDKYGYPNEGMEGMLDSIVSSNIDLVSNREVCIKTNIDRLYNYSNKRLIKFWKGDLFCINKEMSFEKYIEYYNNEVDESYGSNKYFVPFIVDHDVYKKFISEKRFIKTKSKNQNKTLYITLLDGSGKPEDEIE